MTGGTQRGGATRAFRAILVAIALVTVIALVVLWPADPPELLSQGLTAPSESAEVIEVAEAACQPPLEGECTTPTVRITSGPDEGDEVVLAQLSGPLQPDLSVGDGVRVVKADVPQGLPPEEGQPPAGGSQALPPEAPASYTLTDLERRSPMLWLAVAFAALVVFFGRLRGALSLVGLAASLAIVVLFVVPAILDGTEPLVVAIVGSMAVMLLTISLAHGLGPKSLAAMLGTTASLVLVALLALVFVELTQLTGLAGDDAALFQLGGADISFKGLLLAGMLIGALGVLDDVTVSQASTVLALRAANHDLGARELYSRAIEVGRDHVSATVNTLVLAYVGAALPVLLIFGSSQIGFFDAVNVELVAQEIVSTLVGSIGLIAAVPITTGLAAFLATRVAPEDLPADAGHAHVH